MIARILIQAFFRAHPTLGDCLIQQGLVVTQTVARNQRMVQMKNNCSSMHQLPPES